MVEVLETGMSDKIMVYVTTDEKKLNQRLKNIKKHAATYFNEKRRLFARHWLLKPITLKKLGLLSKTQPLPPE